MKTRVSVFVFGLISRVEQFGLFFNATPTSSALDQAVSVDLSKALAEKGTAGLI